MANLNAMIPADRELSEAETTHIRELQDEIDEIWSRRGDYEIDPDAWKEMPIFMENITEDDVQKNASCAALADIVYTDEPPEDIAENMKAQGNRAMQRVMSGEQQENPHNMCRAAVHCYTEGLNAKCTNMTLNSQLYANRAMAHLLMQNFGHGLADAQKAIVMNPDYTKAYFRGARCAEQIRKFDICHSLIDKGLRTKLDENARKEFEELREKALEHAAAIDKKIHSDKLKARSKAAQSASMTRILQGKGIDVIPKAEVSSDQITQYTQGGKIKPYVDEVGTVHVPLLFMYDEFDTTDFMADVATDACMADVLDAMMPFPFDEGRDRYKTFDDIVCFYKIDDGVNMPEYYEIDLGWGLLEVMREPTYKMPGLTPVFHLISRHSDEMLKRFNLRQYKK